MTGSAVSSPLGAEISERSNELVLPDMGGDETASSVRGGKFGVSESRGTNQPATTASAARSDSARPTAPSSEPSERATSPDPAAGARGIALPGDRGPRNQEPPAQRPSFWRRIALGRRGAEADAAEPHTIRETNRSTLTPRKSQVAVHRDSTFSSLEPRDARAVNSPAIETRAMENRIVEPLLQALVSVEAKLERSHTELVGRSDQVEQRLTQLWDIEEQLGVLGELQESLLQVSEQQRRLESAIVSQTQTVRWLVGAVFFSLAAAAFVVAAVLQQ